MDSFDKHMALDVIEDSLTDLDTPHGRGMATGLCGAFYLCGLISEEDWGGYLKRIQAETHQYAASGIFEIKDYAEVRSSRILN